MEQTGVNFLIHTKSPCGKRCDNLNASILLLIVAFLTEKNNESDVKTVLLPFFDGLMSLRDASLIVLKKRSRSVFLHFNCWPLDFNLHPLSSRNS